MQLTGYLSGKLYPLLTRLQRAGWLTREHEAINPATAGRPARRLYRLTPQGLRAARQELAALNQQLRPVARVYRHTTPDMRARAAKAIEDRLAIALRGPGVARRSRS